MFGNLYTVHQLEQSYFFYTNEAEAYLLECTARPDFLSSSPTLPEFYELSFRPANDATQVISDFKVMPTVVDTFSKLIQANPNAVHFYSCDPTDLRHEARSRMFSAYFEQWKMMHPFPYVMITVKIPADEQDDVKNYIYAFFFREDYPHIEDVIQAFEDTVKDNFQKGGQTFPRFVAG